jgi:hypothetical protein
MSSPSIDRPILIYHNTAEEMSVLSMTNQYLILYSAHLDAAEAT